MENRAGSIEVFYAARPEDEVVLVLDETSNFAYHFESEEAARKAYPGVIFEMEQVDLLGAKLLTMFPLGMDPMSPASRKRILIGVIAWAMDQLPKDEPGITQKRHSQIHNIEKLWGK